MDTNSSFQIVGPGRLPKRSSAQRPVTRRLRDYPVISIVLLLVIVIGCIAAGIVANHDPAQFYLQHVNEAPGWEFYFGTDFLGRDIFSAIWYGGRISLAIGLLSMIISTFIGIIYGCMSALGPQWLDDVFMRFAEILSSVPILLLVLLLLPLVGTPGVFSMGLVIGTVSWMSLARIVRGEVCRIRNVDYVLASRVMGASFGHIIRVHLLPNFFSAIMFMIVSNMAMAIFLESTLSFFGIGLPPDIVSWGSLLSSSTRALFTNSWWIIVIPGMFMVTTLVCITNIGHFLRHEVNRSCSYL